MLRLQVRQLRDRAGVSQAALARRAGIARSTLHLLESTTPQRLDVRVLEKLARALKCSPLDLLTDRRR